MLAEIAALALAMSGSTIVDFKAPALYRPRERAVSNWRLESARNLDAPLEALTKDSAKLPRCVRLNNYWCIKSARWNGEIATDSEGHVAFASAREGALVAAQLLRRYYVDLGRTSARAIVSRWAPAECGALAAAPLRVARAGAARPDALSTRGLGNTLRARWLASKGKGGKGAQLSRAPAPRIQLMRAPSIAPGLGESAKPLPAMTAPLVRLASLGVPDKLPTVQPRLQACSGENVRIRNYAAKVAEGVADGPDADLKLFDATGLPTPALTRVMANMAAVEIGPMKPDFALIEKVVAEQTAAWRARGVRE